MQTLAFDESLLDTHTIVDVRTPLEYSEDHIPGAFNVPLLGNEERVEIGILYKQAGPQAARRRGLELTSARFPEMVRKIESLAGDRPILVYCWRGGLRSRTVAVILDLTGYRAVQLEGGYKSFRNHVVSFFEEFVPPGPLVIIHGLTGVGKTTFIHGLSGEKYTVIDLEGLARHRGSAFGGLGMEQPPGQKRFESMLWDKFRKGKRGYPVILEGESRRIGMLSLPGHLYEVMAESIKIWCEASIETRVARLIEEYGKPEYSEGMAEALSRIRGRLGGQKYNEISGYLENRQLGPFMSELLNVYYDRVYYKTKDWSEDFIVSLEDFTEARGKFENFLDRRFPQHERQIPEAGDRV
jgi:tRNA 2-selenouridine synthase